MSGSTMSGVDPARVALKAAMEAARAHGERPGGRQPKRRGRMLRDGRGPVGVGAAIGGLVAARVWDVPAAGGTVLQQWPAIAQKLAVHVAAVAFDAASGQLDLHPDSSAYKVQAQLS